MPAPFLVQWNTPEKEGDAVMIVLREHRLDDLDETESADITRVDFPANGQMYSLDLNEENAATLTELVTKREHEMKRAEEEYRATLADIEMEHATRTAKYVEAAQRVAALTKKSGGRGRPAVGRPIVPERVKRTYNRKAVAQPATSVLPPVGAPTAVPTKPVDGRSAPKSTAMYRELTKPEKKLCRDWCKPNGFKMTPIMSDEAVTAWRESLDKPTKSAKKAAGKAVAKSVKPPVATFSGAE